MAATGCGGIAEIIEHGRNGLLTSFGDGAALIASVSSLLNDGELADRLVTQAFDDYTRLYSREVHQATIQRCVRKTLRPA